MDLQAAGSRIVVTWRLLQRRLRGLSAAVKWADILWVTLKPFLEFEWNVAQIGVRSGSLGPMHTFLEADVWLFVICLWGIWISIKVKAVPLHVKQAQSGRIGIALCILDLSTKRGRCLVPHPGHFISRKQNWYSLYRRLVGPQGCSGWLQTILPPTACELQTTQPALSHYANRAIMAPFYHK